MPVSAVPGAPPPGRVEWEAVGWEERGDLAGSGLEGLAGATTGGGEDVAAAAGQGRGGGAPPRVGERAAAPPVGEGTCRARRRWWKGRATAVASASLARR